MKRNHKNDYTLNILLICKTDVVPNSKHFMKKILPIICLLFIVMSCQKETEKTPKYTDFKNNLQSYNLYGNVQSFTKKVANVSNSKKNKFQEAKVNAVYTFNEAGNYERIEIFNNGGRLETRSVYRYNDADLLVEYKTRTFSNNKDNELRELNAYNEDGLLTHKKVFRNATVLHEVLLVNDTEKNTVKSMVVEHQDTIVMTSQTIVNDQGQITKIIEKSDKNDYENTQSNTYDTSGNLRTHEATMGSIKFKEEYKYKDNIRVERKSYTIPASEEVFLDMVTKYDEQYNIVEMSFYEKSALKRTLSYTYKFDDHGNWIEKRTFVNNDPAKSKTGVPYLIETREITYW